MFKKGQIWSYKNRINEHNSTLLILCVENYKNQGVVIHIAINNIKIKRWEDLYVIADEIQHVPICEKALIDSVIKLECEDVIMHDFSEDYNYWKQAFKNNEGGVWSIEVDKIINYTEKSMNIS